MELYFAVCSIQFTTTQGFEQHQAVSWYFFFMELIGKIDKQNIIPQFFLYIFYPLLIVLLYLTRDQYGCSTQ